MSESEPTGPYVYQPHGVYGASRDRVATDRFFGVGGIHNFATIEGLTREEAEAIVAAMIKALKEFK